MTTKFDTNVFSKCLRMRKNSNDYTVFDNPSVIMIYAKCYDDLPITRRIFDESETIFSDELIFNEKIQKYRYEANLQIEDKKDFPIYFCKTEQYE